MNRHVFAIVLAAVGATSGGTASAATMWGHTDGSTGTLGIASETVSGTCLFRLNGGTLTIAGAATSASPITEVRCTLLDASATVVAERVSAARGGATAVSGQSVVSVSGPLELCLVAVGRHANGAAAATVSRCMRP